MALFRKIARSPGVKSKKLSEALHLVSAPFDRTLDYDDHSTNTGCDAHKTVKDMNGPYPWPVIGNFYAYVKKENRGKLHERDKRCSLWYSHSS